MKRTLGIASAFALIACGGSSATTPPPAPAPEPTPAPQAEPAPAPADSGELPDLEWPDEPFRASQPPPAKPRQFQLPGIKQFKLANGVEVYLVERHELPTINVEITFPTGAVHDPARKAGQASVCMSMMSEGTRKLDKLAFEEALADIASGIGSYGGREESGVWMRSLSKHADTTLDLFVETLLRPGFRKQELDRMVKRRIESLKQIKATAPSVVRRLAASLSYGPAHPLARFQTENSLGAISVADCRKLHKRVIKPKGARLFVVGDITEEQLRKSLGKRLARWRGAPKRGRAPGKPAPRAGRVFFVDIPKAAQSFISMGHLGPTRNAKDFFATNLMARILGGGFSSRVNMNLREDKGYSYGARGGFSYNRNGSRLSVGAPVVSDKTKESLIELYKEYSSMQSGTAPVTPDELAREKDGDILSLPAKFATSRAVLGRYQSLVYFDLPLDYYESYVENTQAVTAQQVMEAAAAHLRPTDLRVMVAGDGATVLPGLYELVAERKLGDGNLVILDADGKVLETITPEQAKAKLGGAK